MSYTVKSGDNLSLIARANGTTVATLMRLNPDVQDANTIYPGQQIQLPASQPAKSRDAYCGSGSGLQRLF